MSSGGKRSSENARHLADVPRRSAAVISARARWLFPAPLGPTTYRTRSTDSSKRRSKISSRPIGASRASPANDGSMGELLPSAARTSSALFGRSCGCEATSRSTMSARRRHHPRRRNRGTIVGSLARSATPVQHAPRKRTETRTNPRQSWVDCRPRISGAAYPRVVAQSSGLVALAESTADPRSTSVRSAVIREADMRRFQITVDEAERMKRAQRRTQLAPEATRGARFAFSRLRQRATPTRRSPRRSPRPERAHR